MTFFEDLLKPFKAINILGKVTVNSILNCLLWAMTIFLFFLTIIIISGKSDVWITVTFIILLALIVLTILGGFIYCVVCKPDYLRSESFQQQKYTMEMMGEKNKEISGEVIDMIGGAKKPLQLPAKKRKKE